MKLLPIILLNIILIILLFILNLDDLRKSKTKRTVIIKMLIKYFVYTVPINGIWIVMYGAYLLSLALLAN